MDGKEHDFAQRDADIASDFIIHFVRNRVARLYSSLKSPG